MYRTEHALSDPGVSGYQISRQLAHEGDKVVTTKHLSLLPPGYIPGTSVGK
jgi:hypothetical protein